MAQVNFTTTDMGNGDASCSNCGHSLDHGNPLQLIPSHCPNCNQLLLNDDVTTMSPYYLGITLDINNKKIIALGFRQSINDIHTLAQQTSPNMPWTAIDMTQDLNQIPLAVQSWLLSQGLPNTTANDLAFNKLPQLFKELLLKLK